MEWLEMFPPEAHGKVAGALLSGIYAQLVAEDLWDILFYENGRSVENFITDAFSDAWILYLMEVDGELAGIAWLGEISETEAGNRACAGYCFFRDFWNPALTREIGRKVLERWFEVDGLDLVWGVTPKPNRLSRLFTTGIGFKYEAVLPKFCSYGGKWVDAMICFMDRERYENGQRGG